MTREEFIQKALERGFTVEQQNGHFVLSVAGNDFGRWECGSDDYRDEMVKWLLSYHPQKVMMRIATEQLSDEIDEAIVDITELWLDRDTNPDVMKDYPEIFDLLQEIYDAVLLTYDVIAGFVRDLYGMPSEPEDLYFTPQDMDINFLAGPHLGLGDIYGVAEVWNEEAGDWWQIDYTFELPEVITEEDLKNLEDCLEVDGPELMEFLDAAEDDPDADDEYPEIYHRIAASLSEEMSHYLEELSLECGCPASVLLSGGFNVSVDSCLVSDQTAKGKLLVRFGDRTEEDTITFTIPEDYYLEENVEAMYSLADDAELKRPESDDIIDEDYYDFFIPKIKEIVAEYLHNNLQR